MWQFAPAIISEPRSVPSENSEGSTKNKKISWGVLRKKYTCPTVAPSHDTDLQDELGNLDQLDSRNRLRKDTTVGGIPNLPLCQMAQI